MKINILSLFPEMMEPSLKLGLFRIAQEKSLVEIQVFDPRQDSVDKYKSADDRPFGGGDGMILLPEVLEKTLARTMPAKKVIYLSPKGKIWNRDRAVEFSKLESLTLICGRYGGLDQRFINEKVDAEISIGDFILSGGELAALVLIESLLRFIPGVLGHQESASLDSFENGRLEYPQFTRPPTWSGQEVPPVLLSGHHQKISEWKKATSILMTKKLRPDLAQNISTEDVMWAKDYLDQMSESERKVCGLLNE